MNYACRTCGESKTIDEMRRYPSGGLSKNCKACGKQKRGKKPRVAVKRRAAAPPPVPPTPVLKIDQGYGLDARIDDGYLRLQQTEGDRVDTLMISKSEAILLFAQFEDWVNA